MGSLPRTSTATAGAYDPQLRPIFRAAALIQIYSKSRAATHAHDPRSPAAAGRGAAAGAAGGGAANSKGRCARPPVTHISPLSITELSFPGEGPPTPPFPRISNDKSLPPPRHPLPADVDAFQHPR